MPPRARLPARVPAPAARTHWAGLSHSVSVPCQGEKQQQGLCKMMEHGRLQPDIGRELSNARPTAPTQTKPPSVPPVLRSPQHSTAAGHPQGRGPHRLRRPWAPPAGCWPGLGLPPAGALQLWRLEMAARAGRRLRSSGSSDRPPPSSAASLTLTLRAGRENTQVSPRGPFSEPRPAQARCKQEHLPTERIVPQPSQETLTNPALTDR